MSGSRGRLGLDQRLAQVRGQADAEDIMAMPTAT